jgi:hypothetical protein
MPMSVRPPFGGTDAAPQPVNLPHQSRARSTLQPEDESGSVRLQCIS